MKLSVQAMQNIFIFVVCIWLILLVNNISNLQRINYDISFVSTTNFRRDDRNSSSSSSGRRRRKESTRQRVYIKNIDIYNNNNNNNNSGRQRKQRRRSKFKKRHQDDESTDDDFTFVESSLRSPHKNKSGPDVDLLLPKPIIVMGFPKAGTSSIFTFFQRQGQNTQHWYCCRGELRFIICLFSLLFRIQTNDIYQMTFHSTNISEKGWFIINVRLPTRKSTSQSKQKYI